MSKLWNVLIVDDSPAMRRVVRRVLSVCDFPCGNVIDAEDGSKALDILRSTTIDVVLTDVNMPKMSGEELLSEIVQDGALRAIPVIVVSTDATQARAEQMLGLGARGYVTKPFLPEELSAELSRAVCLPGVSDPC